ncbi:hypothetical protein [Lentibacillus cibarius]|uniref:XRE family transcriptional regulator n=1 Tax=Lentibacillus cibarius TaxID=2583219 RepID=A0A5S3QJ09_9BACI|nr:hypothetical protein [Lentibacillus cibarius]TMN21920.1 hypothetical protein FFL34_07170 [Lentibacillus cibarius]
MKRNKELRQIIKESKVYNWQVAEAMNMHENTLYRMLRRPLSSTEKQRIIELVKELSSLNNH